MLNTMVPAAPLTAFDRHDGVLEVVELLGHDIHALRLGELGLCAGRTLSVVRPGDPAIVIVGEARLAIAADLQLRLFVAPVA